MLSPWCRLLPKEFTACLGHSRSPRGGSPSSLAPTPTVVPSMEQETPTLQPDEPTVTQLPVEECQQEPASPTPFLPMPKSAAATQLDTDMGKEQEEVPAWFNCSATSPADHMQEDDDGLQQQLQCAEHLTMTLDRVNVRDSDSALRGISDEDDEEEPDDKMSQKDQDKMSGGGCRLSQVDGKEHNCCDWRGSGRTPGSQSSALRQAIGSTHKLQQRRRPMSLRQASTTTCLTRMVELRRGYPGLDSRRRGRA